MDVATYTDFNFVLVAGPSNRLSAGNMWCFWLRAPRKGQNSPRKYAYMRLLVLLACAQSKGKGWWVGTLGTGEVVLASKPSLF